MGKGEPFDRDDQKLKAIRKYEGQPFSLPKILSDEEIQVFKERYAELSKEIAGNQKNNRSHDWDHQRRNEVIVLRADDLKLLEDKVLSRLMPQFEEEFRLKHAQFFYCETPYSVHSDSHFEHDELIHKTIVIPLEVYNDMETYTIVFDQRCYFSMEVSTGGKSFYNVPISPENLHRWVTDYPAKEALDYESLLPPIYDREGQFPMEVCSHLSLAGVFKWSYGVPIVFDRSALHCASALATEGIKYKYGLTLFTSLNSK